MERDVVYGHRWSSSSPMRSMDGELAVGEREDAWQLKWSEGREEMMAVALERKLEGNQKAHNYML
jgi:hypothetical protein